MNIGARRDPVVKVRSSKTANSESSDAVVPKFEAASGAFKAPTQRDQTPFGGIKEQIHSTIFLEEHYTEQKLVDPDTKRFLSKWSTSNPNAKNPEMGRRRRETIEINDGKLEITDANQKESNGSIPRLSDARYLDSPASGVGITGFHAGRQVITDVEIDVELSVENENKSKKIVPWTTGPQIMQTQSKTGGFFKQRDVVNNTYYDERKPRSGMYGMS